MAVRFNADEIFEIAEKIEINGSKFYRKAAEMFDNPGLSDLLNSLASMEDEHRIIFAALRSSVADYEKENTIYDPDDEVKKYLQAIADGKVFDMSKEPADFLTGKETPAEILHYAIGLEKDSIIFYLGMKEMVPEKLGRTKLDRIITEEKNHIITIAEQLEKLGK